MKRRRVRYSNRKYVNRVMKTFKPRKLVEDQDEDLMAVATGAAPKEQGK
jgi:hypothetical protein